MLGNICFLEGDYRQAKDFYRNTLKMAPKPQLEADVLNNLAFTSWMHVVDLPKLKKEGADSDGSLHDQVLKEANYTMSYML